MDLLLIYFIGSAVVACLMFFIKDKWLNYFLYLPFLSLQLMLNFYGYNHLNQIRDDYFRVDPLAMIILSLVSLIGVFAIIHSIFYLNNRKESGRLVSIYNCSIIIFMVSMSGALLSDHLGLMWAFIEGSSVSGAMLIYHNRSKGALEAAWKYFFVGAIGVAMALVGILFLGIAGHDIAKVTLSYDFLVHHTSQLNPLWLKMSFIFIIAGYSVKMGIIPLFSVDIDAKDKAPSPVGALFSGGLMNIGFMAIFRFYELFSYTSILAWMQQICIWVGLASLFFATVYIIKVKNIKRVLAYSSLEHGGLVMMALGVGGLGYFAAFWHLIVHSLIKSALFFQTTQMEDANLDKQPEDWMAYYKSQPLGAIIFFVGIIFILAIPPSGLFVSEFYLLKAFFTNGNYAYAVAALVLLLFIISGLMKRVLNLLFTDHNLKIPQVSHLYRIENSLQIILLVMAVVMGVYPPDFLVLFLQDAVAHLK